MGNNNFRKGEVSLGFIYGLVALVGLMLATESSNNDYNSKTGQHLERR